MQMMIHDLVFVLIGKQLKFVQGPKKFSPSNDSFTSGNNSDNAEMNTCNKLRSIQP